MKRRSFLKSVGLGGAALVAPAAVAARPSPPMKITRVRFYHNPGSRPMINQSFHIVTVETDAGVTGIGEGGSPDLIKQVAGLIIGEDPSRIEHLWQLMFRGYFYPPGRELIHALGAIDLALWDIKGKVLGVPVYELLGGLTRDYIECYSTSFPFKGSLKETARACVESGFRAYRMHGMDPAEGEAFNSHVAVRKAYEAAVEAREGVGKDGDWAIDYHTRFDFPDAVRLSTLIEPLEPYFVEDLIRSENPGVYRELRQQVKVPIAVGEHFGPRWDNNELIENRLIDYARVSIPNCGGITEYVKIASMCETHYVGLIPHFTGPVAEAALVHACGVFPGPVLMEMVGDARPPSIPHLPECYDFRNGKMWPNRRPGLGVTLDTKRLKLVTEITERSRPIPMFHRPDGSITNW
jgi:L-alanine-DL-glutamate epimerase-like enolase superfamily enzyme